MNKTIFNEPIHVHDGNALIGNTFSGSTVIFESEPTSTRQARKQSVLKALYATYRDRKDRNPDRVPGTCEWFTQHKLFQEWRSHESSCMLWVSADPGCGKSVLAKYLVDSVLQTTESGTTTCYFFFKDDFKDQRSAEGALCCILYQLFRQRGDLFSNDVAERFEIDGSITSSFSDLWDILVTSSRTQHAGEIICVLDGFDECEGHGQTELARALCSFYSRANHRSNLKFLITTRLYGQIRRGFEPLGIKDLPVIHLKGEDEEEMLKITKEIDIFINTRVLGIQALLRLNPDEVALLIKKLQCNPNRTYLWVYLTLDIVQNDINIDKIGIEKATSQLPQTVNEAYEKILNKSCDFKESRRLLHIIVAAIRPLTLDEMSLALSLEEGHRCYEDVPRKSRERFLEYMRDLCGLFVTIVDSKIYLLHQTAKEFLVPESQLHKHLLGFRLTQRIRNHNTNNPAWKSSLHPQNSHLILFRICIWHLMFTAFDNPPFNKDNTLKPYLRGQPFLDYSAKSWAAHFRASHTQDSSVIKSVLNICDAGSNRCLTWLGIYWEAKYGLIPPRLTTLIITSYFGLERAVKVLLGEKSIKINSADNRDNRSALSWASENGFHDIVGQLIKGPRIRLDHILNLSFTNGAMVETRDVRHRTPLSYAALNGHEAVVKLLIDAGASVDSEDDIGGTPISYALCNRNIPILSLLLKKGVELGSVDNANDKLLLSAAKAGDRVVVKLLLDVDAVSTQSEDNNVETKRTTDSRHEALIKLAHDSNAIDVNSTDQSFRTPLLLAAENGHEAVVKLLLDNDNVDFNAKDQSLRTALSLAVENGHEAVVKLLLDNNNVDVNAKDQYLRTALSLAVGNGHEAVVKLLLDNDNVDVNAKDQYLRTALSLAAENGHEAAVKLLLNTNQVDVNAQDRSGQTPFSFAAENGHKLITNLLLESGKVHAESALLWAIKSGNENVLKPLFVSKQIDVESKDKKGRTMVSWAASKGHKGLIRLLVESTNTNFDTKDKHGRTPLSLAAENGHKDVVKLLLGSGKLDAKSILSWAAENTQVNAESILPWAVTSGHIGIIKIFLKS